MLEMIDACSKRRTSVYSLGFFLARLKCCLRFETPLIRQCTFAPRSPKCQASPGLKFAAYFGSIIAMGLIR